MKTLLTIIAAVFALAILAPAADAGYYKRVFCGYDGCGRPVYRCVYVPTCHNTYSRGYSHGGYRHYSAPRVYTYRSYGHSHRSYHRPSYGYSYCR